MKKLVVFFLIFMILAIGITNILIKIKNEDKSIKDIVSEKIIVNEEDEFKEENNIVEKTIDLYGTYKENSLAFEEKNINIDDVDIPVKILQIKGLKNKDVENKINEEIEKKLLNRIKSELIKGKGKLERIDGHVEANYSNVLSYRVDLTFDSASYVDVCLNYNLISGEELKLEDLFLKDEDIKSMIKNSIYQELLYLIEVENAGYAGYDLSVPYYDSTDGVWYVEKTWQETGKKEKVEYVMPMTEYEIQKETEKILNDEEKEFYFTKKDISIINENNNTFIDMIDYANKITIYDKYITEESIYENDNMGSKSFIPCTAESINQYKESKYESDNLLYDININLMSIDSVYADKCLQEILIDVNNELKEKIEEYKVIANNNKNKAYFVFVECDFQNVGISEKVYNKETMFYDFSYCDSNLIVATFNSKVIECNIEERKEVLDKILAAYRYYNLGFYGGDICSALGNGVGNIVELNQEIKEDTKDCYYDLLTRKKIERWRDLLKADVDYINVFNSYLINTQIDENVNFEIEYNELKNEALNIVIPYEDVKDALNFVRVKEQILPSSTQKIERADIENMSKDELYLAYNEIFARNGHDFKNEFFRNYFTIWDWYKPVKGKVVSVESLNEIEKYNFNLINDLIKEKYN